MLFLLFAVSVLLGSTQVLTKNTWTNDYMDGVLNGRFPEEAKYSRLDPYRLPRLAVKLNVTGRPNIDRGDAVLFNGSISNLSKVKRSGDCRNSFWQSGNSTYTCSLVFDHLRVNYTVTATYKNMQVTFYPHAAIRGTNVTVQITSNFDDDVPSLKLFFVNHIGSMNVTAQMISIGNLAQVVGPPIRELIVRQATKELYEALNGRWKNALAYSVYKTPFGFISQ